MFLDQLKTFDAQANKKNVFLVSLGSIEQHGPFAPLGTDTFIQEALLKRVEAGVPEVIFLPTLPIGSSWNHLGFFGTISFEEKTLYSMITDIVESIAKYSSTIIFVSWHGGNKPVIDKFIEEKQANYSDIKLVHLTFGSEQTDVEAEKLIGGKLDDHAGNIEVSMSLALHSDITQQPEVGSSKKTVTFDWSKPVISVSQDGIIDANPKWVATKEIGEKLFEVYSKSLIKQIQELIELVPTPLTQ